MRRSFRDLKLNPSAIGDLAKLPFALLPDRATIFAIRAARYSSSAQGHQLSRYLKILQQQKDPDLEPIADGVASLGFDLLVRELGFWRGGANPFLLGYRGGGVAKNCLGCTA
jgi:formate dehydrogenase maturation protein FdhE